MEGIAEGLLALQSRHRLSQLPSQRSQGCERGFTAARPEAIEDAAVHSILGALVDMWVVPIEVAQACLKSMRGLLEHEEAVSLLSGDRIGKTQLEGHVEPRNSKRAGQVDAAE